MRSYLALIFVAVTGGKNKVFMARHLAEMLKKWNIVAMLNNDMIGNSLSSGTLSNNTKVRVFSETIPYLRDRR
jgi:hypothetical protein